MNPQTVFNDPLLTNIYLEYSNPELIGDILAPRIAVQYESGIYFKADKSNLVAEAVGSSKRALNGAASRIKKNITTGTYNLDEHVFEDWNDDRVLKNTMTPYDARSHSAKVLKGKMQLEKENELISALATATASVNNVDVAGAWATITTDIRSAVLAGKDNMHKKTGVRPNTLVIDRPTYNALLTNTAINAAMAYTSDKTENNIRAILAGYFDVNQVLIAGGISQTAPTGGTGSFLWSTKGIAYLAYINPAPAIQEVTSALYQFYKEDMIGVDVRREEAEKSEVVRSTDYYEINVIDADLLYRMYDTIQT